MTPACEEHWRRVRHGLSLERRTAALPRLSGADRKREELNLALAARGLPERPTALHARAALGRPLDDRDRAVIVAASRYGRA
ncbi:hypothetical protein ACTZWW_04225 [Salinarimonas sp. NSM]|uniref:hypothetical protein n=1 Tax=Salinarimonas sp. NSM TaxID=3458003 RepID=UPI004036DAA8